LEGRGRERERRQMKTSTRFAVIHLAAGVLGNTSVKQLPPWHHSSGQTNQPYNVYTFSKLPRFYAASELTSVFSTFLAYSSWKPQPKRHSLWALSPACVQTLTGRCGVERIKLCSSHKDV